MGCYLQHLHGFLVNRRSLPIVSFLQISEISGNTVFPWLWSLPHKLIDRDTLLVQDHFPPFIRRASLEVQNSTVTGKRVMPQECLVLRKAENTAGPVEGGALTELEVILIGKPEQRESLGIRP